MVLLHGFIKKEHQTPRPEMELELELELAKDRLELLKRIK